MHAYIALLLRHRPIVLALLAVFIALGLAAWRRLPIEAFPDVTNVQAQVITLWPGHAAEEVERFVSIPVENQMNSLQKRVSLRSVSLFGLSQVSIVFEDDADNATVRSQLAQRLADVGLPPGAQAAISPDATPIGEIYRYTLTAPKGFPLTELKAIEDWVVERQFRTVPGVVDVNGFGGPTKQYQVLVDPVRLNAHGISLRQVFDALSNGNRNAGGAYIERGAQTCIIRGLGLIQSREDIARIVVAASGGTPVTIGDIGHIEIGNQLRLGRVGIARGSADDDDAIAGTVLLRKGDNAIEVLRRIHAKVDDINDHHLPPGVRLATYYDRTELTDRTLRTVGHNMAEGIALVVLVLVVFLGLANWRSALIVAAVIPLALLGAFTLLDWRHIPANLISMGAIDFGIIVDAAVVVIENIIRLREREPGRRLGQCVVAGVAQMGRPILFSKAILLTAFIPLFTLQRVEGRIFQPMALTLTFALLAGTLLALTVVPILASYFLGRRDDLVPPAASETAEDGREALAVRLAKRGFAPSLALAIRHRALVVAGAALLLAGAGWMSTRLGSEFLPKLDEGALWIRVSMPQSISPGDAARLVRRMRAMLAAFPEARTVLNQLGRPDDGTDINGFDTVEFYVDLKPRDTWVTAPDRDRLAEAMNRRLAEIPGISASFSQYIEDNVNEAVSGIKGELGIKIFGEEPARLQELADRVAAALKRVPGAADVTPEILMGQPQIQIAIDRTAIARRGMAVNDVQQVVETAFGTAVATQVLEGERSFDLAVRLDARQIGDVDAIRAIPVLGPSGEQLTLGDVATVEVRSGAGRIYREDNERRVAVKLSVRDRDLGSLVAEAEAAVDRAVPMPPGYRLVWTGAFENQQRAMGRLAVIVPLTLVAVLFLLMTAFDSLKLGLLVLVNVPLAMVGGIAGLALTGLPLSVSAMVGFIALFGVSVQNGVLLIERIRELVIAGSAPHAAIRDGAMSRLRPVLMTSAMAALGLIPAAISTAVGAETARPFAVVIVGGLVSATALTVMVLPVLCTWLDLRPADDGTGRIGAGG